MPVESASNIDALNSSYPTADDGAGQGDDHIRLIKSVLKTVFASLGTDTLATHLAGYLTTAAAAATYLTSATAAATYETIANVTSGLALKVSKAGDTMTGFLTLNADPSSALHAATKSYVDTAAAGTLGQHTIWVSGGAMKARSTNGATPVSNELPTNDVMIVGYDFNQSTSQGVQFYYQSPKGADETAGLVFQFVWEAGTTPGSGDVVWGVRAKAVGDGDELDSAWGTAQTVTDTYQASGTKLHATAETAVVTPAGTWAEEDLILVEIYRDAANGADTYTQEARLIGVRHHYTINAATDS